MNMRVKFRGFALIYNKEIDLMIREFKKPGGMIIKTDSNVHSKEYIAECAKKFEEVKDTPVKKAITKETKKAKK